MHELSDLSIMKHCQSVWRMIKFSGNTFNPKEGKMRKVSKKEINDAEHVCKNCGARFEKLSDPLPDRCPACQVVWKI